MQILTVRARTNINFTMQIKLNKYAKGLSTATIIIKVIVHNDF